MASSVVSVFSWCLGLLDQLGSVVHIFLGKSIPKFFSAGWGDVEEAFKSQDKLLERLEKHQMGYLYSDININWGKPTVQDDVIVVSEGRFTSPLADRLPPVAKKCQVFLVNPARTSTSEPLKTVVIMLPATGEMSKRARLSMARELARGHGWSSVIVTAPFYGLRKPTDQNRFFISNVKDFLLQSQAIMEETVTLVSYFQQQSDFTKVCVTGFSWGGAMASGAASIAMLAGCDGSRLALVPYVGCPSPAAITEGVLNRYLNVESLQEFSNGTMIDAENSLRLILTDVNISTFIDMMIDKRRQRAQQSNNSETKHLYLGALKVVAMQHDHIIPYKWATDLVHQLSRLCSVASTTQFPTQWLPGGHAMAALVKNRMQAAAIVEAVQALE